MEQLKSRTIKLDNDEVVVSFIYDEKHKVWNGDYPDFEENPKYTPRGRPWVNVISDGCPFTTEEYGDCGSCRYLLKEIHTDLIGVCMNDKMQKL